MAIGTRQRHEILETRTYYLALATDQEASISLIGRAIGQQAAAQGSFHFDVDDLHRWFRTTDIDYQPEALRPFVRAIIDLPRHLGSIEVTGVVLAFRTDDLHSFWIETTEGEKRRVYSGFSQAGAYSPLPAGWTFSAPSLAREIARLY